MAFRFKLLPKDDLSMRSDFTLDLTRAIGKEITEAVEASPQAAEIKAKADLDVRVVAGLTKIDVTVDIKKKADVEFPKADLDRLRSEISDRINETVKDKMTQSIQKAIKSARARM